MVLVNLKKRTITMRTLFFFIVFSLSLTLNAQLTKGNWLVGGSGTTHHTDTGSIDTKSKCALTS